MTKYKEIKASEIPKGIRFDVSRRNQGQIVEIAYGTFARSEADHGDPYKRITDHSIRRGQIGRVKYFKL